MHTRAHTGLFVRILISLVIIFATSVAYGAWTGPLAAPPDGNVSAPINVSGISQVKDGALGVNALAVYGDTIFSGATTTYTNYGDTAGSGGYGIRDNAGTMEFKSSDGSWAALGSISVSPDSGADGDYQVFTSDGTWTKPANTSDDQVVIVEMWGGGGGGRDDSPGGGGGGGAYNRFELRAGDLASSVSVTAGAGGTLGNNGGTSSFGPHGSAYGGAGGGGNGGGGGGRTSAGSISDGGGPDWAPIYSGGSGGVRHNDNQPGHAIYGGAGGGDTSQYGANSVWGGGGGGGYDNNDGGTSLYGGDGGDGGQPGDIPGGGGGRGAAGARGEVRVWVVPAAPSSN